MTKDLPHILVIEDNPAIAQMIEYALCTGERSYRFSHVYDGNLALEQVKILQPDLIVLDLQLPGTNGYEIARQLRLEGYNVPILMLTALRDRESEIKGLQSGCDDYLTKPFMPTLLRVRVEALLRRVTMQYVDTTVAPEVPPEG